MPKRVREPRRDGAKVPQQLITIEVLSWLSEMPRRTGVSREIDGGVPEIPNRAVVLEHIEVLRLDAAHELIPFVYHPRLHSVAVVEGNSWQTNATGVPPGMRSYLVEVDHFTLVAGTVDHPSCVFGVS